MPEGNAVRDIKRVRIADFHEDIKDEGECYARDARPCQKGQDHFSDFHW